MADWPARFVFKVLEDLETEKKRQKTPSKSSKTK